MNDPRNQLTELQERWLSALESGGYGQIEGHLCQSGNYCCLGVATHVVNPDHPALQQDGWDKADWIEDQVVDEDPELFSTFEDGSFAPPDVAMALHLNNTNGRFRFMARIEIEGNHHDGLVALNDNTNWTFEHIAEFIREKPWLVFTNFDPPAGAAS